jgi:hypothetical protein
VLAEHLRMMSDQIDACRHILSRLAVPCDGVSSLPEGAAPSERARRLVAVNKDWTLTGPSKDSEASRGSLHLFGERG